MFFRDRNKYIEEALKEAHKQVKQPTVVPKQPKLVEPTIEEQVKELEEIEGYTRTADYFAKAVVERIKETIPDYVTNVEVSVNSKSITVGFAMTFARGEERCLT